MSVLIKGMKMPMGCYECPFEVWGKCMFIHYNASGAAPKLCPLVEVPMPKNRASAWGDVYDSLKVLEALVGAIEAEEK